MLNLGQEMELRQQYHFRKSEKGLLSWDVLKLIRLSSELEVKRIKLSEIRELDENFWYELGGADPTCRNIADHVKLIQDADLSYLIILCSKGRIMDGMHRVCKALISGHEYISAVRFETEIEPDYIGLTADELPY